MWEIVSNTCTKRYCTSGKYQYRCDSIGVLWMQNFEALCAICDELFGRFAVFRACYRKWYPRSQKMKGWEWKQHSVSLLVVLGDCSKSYLLVKCQACIGVYSIVQIHSVVKLSRNLVEINVVRISSENNTQIPIFIKYSTIWIYSWNHRYIHIYSAGIHR